MLNSLALALFSPIYAFLHLLAGIGVKVFFAFGAFAVVMALSSGRIVEGAFYAGKWFAFGAAAMLVRYLLDKLFIRVHMTLAR